MRRIGIDLMGSDASPTKLYEAVVHASLQYPHDLFHVYVTHNTPLIPHPRIKIIAVADEISMHDDPIKAIKAKKNSTLLAGIKQIKKHKIDAFITAGNTGALIALSSLYLPKAPGIKRPALLATLPTLEKPVSVLDAGGTVQCKAPLLAHFAELGLKYHAKAFNIEKPKFALLNIGVESKKGSLERREAFEKLKSDNLPGEFIGNIEGRDLFSGKVDVIVTDGFSGNLLIKTAEGTATYIFEMLQGQLNEHGQSLYKKFDWMEHPGAIVLGVEGIVMKCHGSVNSKSLLSGIKGVFRLL